MPEMSCQHFTVWLICGIFQLFQDLMSIVGFWFKGKSILTRAVSRFFMVALSPGRIGAAAAVLRHPNVRTSIICRCAFLCSIDRFNCL